MTKVSLEISALVSATPNGLTPPSKLLSSIYLTKDQQVVIEDLNNFDFRSFRGINTQAQERTDNVRMSNPPIISNEEIDANTQDKNSIG
jgi:hypothetical protein